MLEIGTTLFGGGSVIMFHEYFKDAQIHSIDLEPKPDIWDKYDRITHYQMDAYKDDYFLKLINNKYDFILDDGSHNIKDQMYVVDKYVDLLNDKGILIIEDIQNIRDCKVLLDRVDDNYNKKVYDLRNNKHRQDDIFIFIQKK